MLKAFIIENRKWFEIAGCVLALAFFLASVIFSFSWVLPTILGLATAGYGVFCYFKH